MRTIMAVGVSALAAVSLAGCRAPPGIKGLSSRSTAVASAATATARPTPPSLLPPDVLTVLRRYTLAQSDLPTGYSAGGLLEVPNDQAANDYADAQVAKQEMSDTGRQGGLGQQLTGPPSIAGTLGVSIELFKDAAGAQRWASQPPASSPALQMTPEPVDRPFGDASSAMHWSQGGQSGYVLSFSQGRIVYGLGIQAPAGQESLVPLEVLAQSLEQKAKQQSN